MFQKNFMRIVVRKLLVLGLVPARVCHRKAEVEKADCRSSRQERVCVVVSHLLMQVDKLEIEDDVCTMATFFFGRAEGVWKGRWKKSSRRLGGSRSLNCRHGHR